MTRLVYNDPETGEECTLDLTGWRFRVTLGAVLLTDRELVPHFLQAAIEIELGDEIAPRGVAPLALIYTDGQPCLVSYFKAGEEWLR